MRETLITSYKFMVPGREPRILARPRLAHLLDSFSPLPWTTVIAPNGYGKTTVVADWARERSHLVWYTLDASDDDPDIFRRRLTRALHPVSPSLGGALTSTPLEIVLDVLGDYERDITIVLDDAHTASRSEVWEIIQSLVTAGSPWVHVVIVGQTSPRLDLDSARLRGQLGEISIADLVMHEDEARTFLRRGGDGGLEPDEVESIVATADGWIAGLKMALLGHQGRPGAGEWIAWDWGRPFVASFERLAEQWPASFLHFMVSTALPSRVCGDLIATFDLPWLEGKDPDLVLRDIGDAGLFLVPMGSHAHWYRFQALFRDELIQRASRLLSDAQVQEIYIRTAHWHSQNGDIAEAIHHLLLAGCLHEASELVRSVGPTALALDQWRDVAQWLQQLGAKTVDGDIDLLICRAWVAQIEGKHEIVRSAIDKARASIQLSQLKDDIPRVARIESELDLIETMTSFPHLSGDMRAKAYERAFTELRNTGSLGEMLATQYYLMHVGQDNPEEARRLADSIIIANADNDDKSAQIRVLWARIGQLYAYGSIGEMHQLLDMSQAILTLSQALGAGRQVAHGHFLVASALYELDRLAEAEEHFRIAWQMPEAGIRVWVGAGSRLAKTLDAMQRFDEADALLQTCLDRLLERQATEFIRFVRVMETRMLFGRNQSFKSSQLVWALEEIDPQYAATEIENPMFARALVLAESDLPEHAAIADRTLDALLAHPDWLHWLGSRIQVKVLEAYRYYRHQNYIEASRLLAEAVGTAERVGYRRVLCDLGAGIEAMLFWFHDQHRHWPYLADLVQRLQANRVGLERTQHPSPKPKPSVNESAIIASLSRRERDVLEGLCRRYTDKEIAELLSISTTTVKSHTRSIYRKLDVNNRRQVIAKVGRYDLPPINPSSPD
ncbi:MAG: hypothetical protein KC435_02485 [Thermomicrobiales bacterium]|nr:hypothetical protein [Thermomicrobiales bacterium]